MLAIQKTVNGLDVMKVTSDMPLTGKRFVAIILEQGDSEKDIQNLCCRLVEPLHDLEAVLKGVLESKLCHADQLDAGQSRDLYIQPLHQESVVKFLEANRDRLRQIIIAHNKAKRTNLLKKAAHLIKDKLLIHAGHAEPRQL